MQRAGNFRQLRNFFQNIVRPRERVNATSSTEVRGVYRRTSSFRESQATGSPTALADTSIQRRNITIPIIQQKTLTQKKLDEIKESIQKTEAVQIVVEKYKNCRIGEAVKKGVPQELFTNRDLEKKIKKIEAKKLENLGYQKIIEAPTKAFKKTQGYKNLKMMFDFDTLESVESAFENQLTIKVKKDGTMYTLIFTPNNKDLSYYVLPGDIDDTFNTLSDASGASKLFWKKNYQGVDIPVTEMQNTFEDTNYIIEQNMIIMHGLPQVESNIEEAKLRGMRGAELLIVPKLIGCPYQKTTMVAPVYGKTLSDTINCMRQQGILEENLEKTKAFVRDIYVASNCLQNLGYTYSDIKPQNTIIIPTTEGDRAALIDIDDIVSGTRVAQTYCYNDLFMPIAKKIAGVPATKKKNLVAQYYNSIACLRILTNVMNNEGTEVVNLLDTLISFRKRQNPIISLKENPTFAFAVAESPKAFLKGLIDIYEERIKNNKDIESNKAGLKNIQGALQLWNDIEKDCVSEVESIKLRIRMLHNIKGHSGVIQQHLGSLLEQSKLSAVQEASDIPQYTQEAGRPPHSDIASPKDNNYALYDVRNALLPVFTSSKTIDSMVQDFRKKLDIKSDSSITDEKIEFLLKMICEPESTVLGNNTTLTLELAEEALKKMNRIIGDIVEHEKYVKAEYETHFYKKAYVE